MREIFKRLGSRAKEENKFTKTCCYLVRVRKLVNMNEVNIEDIET